MTSDKITTKPDRPRYERDDSTADGADRDDDTTDDTQVGQLLQGWGNKLTERLPTTRPRSRTSRRSSSSPSRDRLHELITALGDPEHPEHASSIETLTEIGSPAVPALNDALNNQHSWLLSYRAAEVLGRIGDGRAAGPLIQALRHSNSNVRWSAVRALALVGDLRALFELRRVAHEDHGRTSWGESVAGAAQSALDQIQAQSVWSQSLELIKTAVTSVLMILSLVLAFSVVTTLRSEIAHVGLDMPPDLLTPVVTVVPTEPATSGNAGAPPQPQPSPPAAAAAGGDASALPTPAAEPPTLVPAATVTPTPATETIAGTVESGANVRPFPSVQNEPIGAINQGDEIFFEAVSANGMWYKISLGARYDDSSYIDNPDGSAMGWVHRELVSEPDGELPVEEPDETDGDLGSEPTATDTDAETP